MRTVLVFGLLLTISSAVSLAFAPGQLLITLVGLGLAALLLTSWGLGRVPGRLSIALTASGVTILAFVLAYVAMMWLAATGHLGKVNRMSHGPGLCALFTAFGLRLVAQGQGARVRGYTLGVTGLVIGGILDAAVIVAIIVAGAHAA